MIKAELRGAAQLPSGITRSSHPGSESTRTAEGSGLFGVIGHAWRVVLSQNSMMDVEAGGAQIQLFTPVFLGVIPLLIGEERITPPGGYY